MIKNFLLNGQRVLQRIFQWQNPTINFESISQPFLHFDMEIKSTICRIKSNASLILDGHEDRSDFMSKQPLVVPNDKLGCVSHLYDITEKFHDVNNKIYHEKESTVCNVRMIKSQIIEAEKKEQQMQSAIVELNSKSVDDDKGTNVMLAIKENISTAIEPVATWPAVEG